MIRRGSWTRARAIAVRCCSPPESVVGSCSAWAAEADDRERAVDGRAGSAPAGVPVTSRANATFSRTDRVGSSLKSWKTIPIRRRSSGTLRRGHAGQVAAVDDHLAGGRQLVADQELEQRRLAGARRADQEDELALAEGEVDVAQGDLAVGVGLADAAEGEDRARGCRRRPGAGSGPGGGIGGRRGEGGARHDRPEATTAPPIRRDAGLTAPRA